MKMNLHISTEDGEQGGEGCDLRYDPCITISIAITWAKQETVYNQNLKIQGTRTPFNSFADEIRDRKEREDTFCFLSRWRSNEVAYVRSLLSVKCGVNMGDVPEWFWTWLNYDSHKSSLFKAY